MSATDSLIDHVLIWNHIQRHVIGHRDQRVTMRELLERSGTPIDQFGPQEESRVVIGAGEPIIATGAPHHAGSGRFLEVAWPCGCGQALHADPDRLLHVWARHVERECGVDAGRLAQHYVMELRGFTPTAYCACGESFSVPPDTRDPYDPAQALANWEAHVREWRPVT